MRARLCLLLVVAVLAALVDIRTSQACSCPGPERIVQPSGDGAFLNTMVIYYDNSVPDFLNLRTADGYFVDTAEEVINGGYAAAVLLRPYELLEPETDYAVYSGRNVVGTFRTGTEESHEAPEAPALDGVAAYQWVWVDENCGGDSCVVYNSGGSSQIVLEYEDPPSDVALLVMTVVPGGADAGGPAVQLPILTRAYWWWDGRSFGSEFCSPWAPDLSSSSVLDFEWHAYALNGVGHGYSGREVPVAQCAANGCGAASECVTPVVVDVDGLDAGTAEGGDDAVPSDAGAEDGGNGGGGCATTRTTSVDVVLALAVPMVAIARRRYRTTQSCGIVQAR